MSSFGVVRFVTALSRLLAASFVLMLMSLHTLQTGEVVPSWVAGASSGYVSPAGAAIAAAAIAPRCTACGRPPPSSAQSSYPFSWGSCVDHYDYKAWGLTGIEVSGFWHEAKKNSRELARTIRGQTDPARSSRKNSMYPLR